MTNEEIKYPVYKGLQKPLVYRGFKGRYIFWALGFLIMGFILAGTIGSIANVWLGFLGFLVSIVGGLYYTSQKQKKGLYTKQKDRDIVIIKPLFNRRNFKNRSDEEKTI